MEITKNSKSQITNNKQIPMIKNQTYKNRFFGHFIFGFGHCLKFDVCPKGTPLEELEILKMFI